MGNMVIHTANNMAAIELASENPMKKFSIVAVVVALLMAPTFAKADAPADGTYDAVVTTDSGTYAVPVEVEDGEVSVVHWPNGGEMNVVGADLDNGEATGTNLRGDSLSVEIDDSSYDADSDGN